jgi:hypothetical protein
MRAARRDVGKEERTPMLRYFTALTFVLSALSLVACGDEAEDEVQNTVNCAKICGRYSECVTEIDVSSCTDRCEDNADANATYASQASQCDECTDGDACGDIQGCWASCPVVAVAD